MFSILTRSKRKEADSARVDRVAGGVGRKVVTQRRSRDELQDTAPSTLEIVKMYPMFQRSGI